MERGYLISSLDNAVIFCRDFYHRVANLGGELLGQAADGNSLPEVGILFHNLPQIFPLGIAKLVLIQIFNQSSPEILLPRQMLNHMDHGCRLEIYWETIIFITFWC